MLGMIQEIASKNLAKSDINVSSRDEIGQAETALNGMKNSLRELINSIALTAEQVASAISRSLRQRSSRLKIPECRAIRLSKW